MPEPLRVLVVEDEAPILMQLEMTVEDEGHEVVGTAMGSRDAIRLIDTMKPDLVLLDLNLGDGASGLSVAEMAHGAGANIVFMTANPSQANGFEGALGTLAKPFSRFAVLATLRYIAECIRTPPPRSPKPEEFFATSALTARIGSAVREA